MKKTISLILVMILVALPLLSCSKDMDPDAPEGMLTARSAELDLRVFYPENWSITENGKQLKIVSAEQMSLEGQLNSADVTDGKAILPSNVANVIVHLLKRDVSDLETYAEGEYLESFNERYVFDPEVYSKPTSTGDARRIYTYRLIGDNETVLYRFSQMLVLHDECVYAVTFTATNELYELLLSDARDVMESLVFDEISEEDASALTTAVDAAKKENEIPQKDGFYALSNDGVDFILYYPKEAGWKIAADTGYLALEQESGASVSVARGDGVGVRIGSLEEYLDEYHFPSVDALLGSHTEAEDARVFEEREDALLCRTTYSACAEGEEYTFHLALFYRKSGYIYTLLYTAKTAEYQAYLPSVETMIDEIVFEG